MSAEVGAEEQFDAEDEFYPTAPRTNAYEGDELLRATIRQIEASGGQFFSRGRATMYETATIDKVTDAYAILTEGEVTPAEREEMAEIIDWVDHLEPGAEDTYLLNLKAGLTRDVAGHVIVYATAEAPNSSSRSSPNASRRPPLRSRPTGLQRMDENLHRPEALRRDRRPAHLPRHHHRNRHRLLPPGPHT